MADGREHLATCTNPKTRGKGQRLLRFPFLNRVIQKFSIFIIATVSTRPHLKFSDQTMNHTPEIQKLMNWMWIFQGN